MRISNINRFLASAFRTDVIGREMWNGKINEGKSKLVEEQDYYVRPDKECGGYSVQMPQFAWDPPALGLPGTWAYGQHTNLTDVFKINVAETSSTGERELNFVATRNNWTPAYLTTYYRSTSDSSYPYGGVLTIKETKCIDGNNVFVSECKFINDCNERRGYRVGLQLPHFTAIDDGYYSVNATIMPSGMLCGQDKVTITGYAVAMTSTGKTAFDIELLPHQTVTIRFCFAVSEKSGFQARAFAEAALKKTDIFENNEQDFNNWMQVNAPNLEIEDLDLLKIYYYRWFVVYRALHEPRSIIKMHPYQHSAFFEAPFGLWFGCAIGLPVPCQVLESRWLANSKLSCGHVLNWGEKTCGYMNYLQFTPMAIWKWYLASRDLIVLKAVYPTMKEYSLKDIDETAPSRLPVQHGSWMTGAEYQPNFYQFTQPDKWDWRFDDEGAEKWGMTPAALIRPDLCAHTIANLNAAASAARVLGLLADAEELTVIARQQLESLVSELWSEEKQCFVGADPVSAAHADEAICYDSFMPYLWGMITDERYTVGLKKIFDETLFWDEFPVTSAAKKTPMYWSGNCLVGPAQASLDKPHAYPCSWNGPSWHYANGLLTAALGSVAEGTRDAGMKAQWLELFGRWSEMHFLYGDRSTPCAVEHHRPTDGARFRNIVDYFHNAWLDPFFSYYLGIRIEISRLEFSPFFHGEFWLKNVVIGGQQFSFRQYLAASGEVIRKIYLDDFAVADSSGDAAACYNLESFS